MSSELFDQLEKKVSQAVDTIEMLQLEVEELRQDNQRLKDERQQWEGRLNRIIEQLGSLDDSTDAAPQAPAAQQPHSGQ
ncbi:cell division protein ZapB [Zymobacter sp. IVIA_12111.31 C1]|uniref:cell division protein ZapB n=1 Tax=Zymobacter sp. IVIA_12111.31 C1 TaxID=3394854 RepID=UPI0039C01ABC